MNRLIKFAIALLLTALSSSPCVICSTLKSVERVRIPFVKTHVAVFNYLDGSNFKIHCKSGDDDLGTHEVRPKDKHKWGFRVNVLETTLHVCEISWRGGRGTFDIFQAKRDDKRCGDYCEWHVADGGVYGYNSTHSPDVVYQWTK